MLCKTKSIRRHMIFMVIIPIVLFSNLMKKVNRKNNYLLKITLILLSLSLPHQATADSAITIISGGSANQISSYVVGYDFTVDDKITIDKLGIIDQNNNGVIDESAAPEVGIWNSAGDLLVSATIPLGSPVDSGSFYASIDPLELPRGTYTIGATNYAGGERFWYNSNIESGSGISFVRGRFIKSASLQFPSSVNATSTSYFGPNFTFKNDATLTISSPLSPSIYQRRPYSASIPIKGKAFGASSIQARLTVITGSNGSNIPWTTIDNTINDGSFSGKLTAENGWYHLDVRALSDSQVISQKSLSDIGVGDIFIIAGQSNSANYGGSRQTVSDPRVLALNWSNTWQVANDPQPRATGNNGSPWPAMANSLVSELDIPIGIVSVGQGSTTVGQWESYLYESRLKPAIEALSEYGFKAVLWHQGESDSLSATSSETYASLLRSTISASREDAGFSFPWGIALASYHPNSTIEREDEIIAGQLLAIDNEENIYEGPTTNDFGTLTYLHDGVHFNTAGLTEHGQRWARFILSTLSLNLADNKTASQSSTAHGGSANRAIDGNISGHYGDASTTHTGYENNPWWQVDLGSKIQVNSIRLWNRTDCCTDRLSNFYVFVSNSDISALSLDQLLSDNNVWKHQVSGQVSESLDIDVNSLGRYVRIQKVGYGYLSLAEVEIKSRAPTIPLNLAYNKTASQSSTAYGGSAGRAIDGNISGHYGDASTTHTGYENNPWWQVDLGSETQVNSIHLWNRTDCCTNRLSNFYVFVSDSDISALSLDQLLSDNSVWKYQVSGQVSETLNIDVNSLGRYVRIQKIGYGYLSLAEVEVN
ncbi:MAG: discoidin domain-containing protein [Methylococcales bacterium]|nr:discoidin domain-containing protein [Methylococcales bacterium]